MAPAFFYVRPNFLFLLPPPIFRNNSNVGALHNPVMAQMLSAVLLNHPSLGKVPKVNRVCRLMNVETSSFPLFFAFAVP